MKNSDPVTYKIIATAVDSAILAGSGVIATTLYTGLREKVTQLGVQCKL